MFDTNKINKKYNKIKKAMASLMAVVMVAASVAIGITINTKAGDEDVQVILSDMLGVAKNFGLFANEFYLDNDFEANIAVNKFYSDYELAGNFHSVHSIGGTKSNTPGTFYFNEVVGNIVQFKGCNTADYVVTGTDYQTYNVDEQGMLNQLNANTIQLRNDYKTEIRNIDIDDTLLYRPDYIDVDAGLEYVENVFTEYYNAPNFQIDLNDQKMMKIDATKTSKQIAVVDFDASVYEDRINSFGPGIIEIKKKENQVVVINVKNIKDSKFDMSRYTVNGIPSSEDNASVADTIIWNFGDNATEVIMREVSGIIIAPHKGSFVKILSTSRGRVIASAFTNIAGELHFLSADVSKERESDTEKETTTVQEETTAEKTTIQAETTTAEKTTESKTTTQAETTTAEKTTESKTTTQAETTTAEKTTESKTTTQAETTTAEKTTESKTTQAETTTAEKTTASKTTQAETTTAEKTSKPQATTKTPKILGDDETTSVEKTTADKTTKEDDTTTVESTTKDKSVAGDDEFTSTPGGKKTPKVAADEEIKTGDNKHTVAYIFILAVAFVMFLVSFFSNRKNLKHR